MLVRDRQRDRSRPGPDVEHRRLGAIRDQLEAALDEHLGLGPRDQDAGIDAQREPAESPLAQHVRERLARSPASDELAEEALPLGRHLVAVCVQLGTRDAERVREQPLRVHARRRHSGPLSSSVAATRRSRTVTLRARGAGPPRPAPR